jgi:hypothetical protein
MKNRVKITEKGGKESNNKNLPSSMYLASGANIIMQGGQGLLEGMASCLKPVPVPLLLGVV